MRNIKLVACWHHGDKDCLFENLKKGFIDIYGEDEFTPKGTNRQNNFIRHMRLKPEDRIRIKVGREIVAFATIVDGKPFELDEDSKRQRGSPWTAGIMVKSVHYVEPPEPASCSPVFQGSHRFDTPIASHLDR